jgi:hypothetical protein
MTRSTLRVFSAMICIPIAILVALAGDPSPQAPGQEWKKVEVQNVLGQVQEQSGYTRPLVGSMFRLDKGHYTSYGVKLKKYTLTTREEDDLKSLIVSMKGDALTDPNRLYFSMECDEKGKTTRHVVSFGAITYYDLNGDGVIDCWTDSRKTPLAPTIIYEDRMIEVESSLNCEAGRFTL